MTITSPSCLMELRWLLSLPPPKFRGARAGPTALFLLFVAVLSSSPTRSISTLLVSSLFLFPMCATRFRGGAVSSSESSTVIVSRGAEGPELALETSGAFFLSFVLGEGTTAGTGGGGGFGRANISVHWRAVESCVLRLRTNWVAMAGTK